MTASPSAKPKKTKVVGGAGKRPPVPELVETGPRHLLGLRGMDREDLTEILNTAEAMRQVLSRPVKKLPTLRGTTVVNLFYEPSTRTRLSFELATKRLSADIVNVTAGGSSAEKGETLTDVAKTIQAMQVDIIVIRHALAGAPQMIAQAATGCSVVNAGDGSNEHPTQSLLDMMTIRDNLGAIEGLKVTLVGDIAHSRVASSNIWGLTEMGAEVTVCGPPTLIPGDVEKLGVRVKYSLDKALDQADVVMLLRMQLERQRDGLFPSLREYSRFYMVDERALSKAKDSVLVMHPGPMNRGVEISPEVADGAYSVINQQVTNGVAVRMAVLYMIAGNRMAGGAAT